MVGAKVGTLGAMYTSQAQYYTYSTRHSGNLLLFVSRFTYKAHFTLLFFLMKILLCSHDGAFSTYLFCNFYYYSQFSRLELKQAETSAAGIFCLKTICSKIKSTSFSVINLKPVNSLIHSLINFTLPS